MRFLALLLCLVMVGQVSEGAERKKDKKKKGQPVAAVDSTKVKPKGIPAIKDFIKANAVKHAGMFNVYEQADRYFMEIPDELLGRDVFVFVSLIKGSAKAQRSNMDMMGYGGDALYSKVIRFEKGPKDRMYLHEPLFTTVMPDTANALYGAIEASNLMPIVNGLDIKAKSENSSLIDITDLYKSDHYYFSLKGAAEMLNLGAYQADQSYTTTISSYPNNIIFRSVRSYAPGKAPKVRPGMPAADFKVFDREGKEYTLASFKGKYIFLEFSASWCSWCKKEIPSIRQAYERFKDSVVFITIHLDDNRDKWLKDLETHAVPWYCLTDLKAWKSPVAKAYNIAGCTDPSGRGGVQSTTSGHPAILAGSASMSTVEKSGELPPGIYNPTRLTGTGRCSQMMPGAVSTITLRGSCAV